MGGGGALSQGLCVALWALTSRLQPVSARDRPTPGALPVRCPLPPGAPGEGCCRWEESGLRSSLKYCTYLRTGIITRGTRPGRMGECQGLSAGAETPRKSGVASRVQGELGEPVVLEATLTKHFKEQRSTAGVPRSIDAVSDRKPVVRDSWSWM